MFPYLTAIAEMRGIDLASEVARRTEVNRRRVYVRNEEGVLERIGTDEDAPPVEGS